MTIKLAQNKAIYEELKNAKLYRLPNGRYYSNSPIMNALIYIESKGRADAKNPTSSATGLLQQINSNAEQYNIKGKGFDNRRDPFASFDAGRRFAIDNLLNYDRNGIVSDAKKQYLAHQQGPGGAVKILRGQTDATLRRNMAANAGAKAGGDFAGYWGRKVDEANRALAKIGVAAGQVTGQEVTGLTTPSAMKSAPSSITGLTTATSTIEPTPPTTTGLTGITPIQNAAAKPLQELGFSYTDNATIGSTEGLAVPNLTLPQDIYDIKPVAARRTI